MSSSREQLKQYCLRNLGAPVLEVNVDDDQLEDRIDEALEYFRLYHYDGIEKVYLKQKINASTLTITTPTADQFENSAVIIGQTSGAMARILIQVDGKKSEGTTIVASIKSGEFINGEVISDGTHTATLAATNAVTLGEFDKRYFDLNDWVYGVSRVLPFAGTQTSKSMFDIQYQLRLNDLYDLTSTSIIYYKMVMSHLSLLDLELNGKPQFRFNRMSGRLYLDINWAFDLHPGEYVMVECYRAMDPSEFTRVWNEPWLKHYVTALFKRAWATNLKKFGGMQLPGGVVLDGQTMYNEAIQEIKDLENDLMVKSAPLEFFLG